MEVFPNGQKMARLRDLTFAELFAIGCALLICSAVGLGGLMLVGGLYYRSRPAPTPFVFPPGPIVTSTPQLFSEQPTLPPVLGGGPPGKIVYVCQMFDNTQERDQICLMNTDGSGQRRLTSADYARHLYPSLSPDGQSVFFSSNMDGDFEIYELVLASGQLNRLAGLDGIAPEVSPDNQYLALTRSFGGGID